MIVGAGFGGLAAARALANDDIEVVIVDRRNHHLFQPLLYQVATAGLNPSDIAKPIRSILKHQRNVQPVMADVTGIDTAASTITTTAGTLGYDYLIVAAGATHAYFGNDQWAELAPGLKTIEDALDIRRRILLAFEQAELTDDPVERKRQMSFVVIGAGPTGVELAGAIKEIAGKTLRSDFRRIDTTEATVILVDAADRALPAFPHKLSSSARKQLEGLGVQVHTSVRVTDITPAGVEVSSAEGTTSDIPAATVLWGAGVAASPVGAMLNAELDRSGRVKVADDLSVPGSPNVFVVGDLAAATDSSGTDVPGVAPAAQQGGRHAAASIRADLSGLPRTAFTYHDKGSLATIGRSRAVADLGPRLRFGGYVAWVIWWLVHIMSLIDFRSRLSTMASWGWQYFTGYRGARLITGDYDPPLVDDGSVR